MKTAPIPQNEIARQCAVENLKILNTEDEERFNHITKKATEIFKVPISTISIIDNEREWYKAKEGITVTEGPRSISFCGHALLQEDIFIVEDTLNNSIFADNPLVTGTPGIRFYAGKSLYKRPENLPVGVFCIKDYCPRKMTANEIAEFLELAETAENELNATING